jgi:hypothetical protein
MSSNFGCDVIFLKNWGVERAKSNKDVEKISVRFREKSYLSETRATRALKLTFLSFFLSFHPFNLHQIMTHAPISSLSFEYNPRKNELEVEQAGKDTLFPLSNAFCETQTYTHLHYLYLSGYLPLSFSFSPTLSLSHTHTHTHTQSYTQKETKNNLAIFSAGCFLDQDHSTHTVNLSSNRWHKQDIFLRLF